MHLLLALHIEAIVHISLVPSVAGKMSQGEQNVSGDTFS